MKNQSRLGRQLAFLCEIDKVKSVRRHTLLMDGSRRENDAEHTWHLAIMALIFSELSRTRRLDLITVIKMLLIHDIVEIHGLWSCTYAAWWASDEFSWRYRQVWDDGWTREFARG
jgi:putative hydrolase of HD superfamily